MRGARYRYMTFDDRQQAGQRGAAKEVIFPGFRPDGNGERRAVFTVCEFQNRTSQNFTEILGNLKKGERRVRSRLFRVLGSDHLYFWRLLDFFCRPPPRAH